MVVVSCVCFGSSHAWQEDCRARVFKHLTNSSNHSKLSLSERQTLAKNFKIVVQEIELSEEPARQELPTPCSLTYPPLIGGVRGDRFRHNSFGTRVAGSLPMPSASFRPPAPPLIHDCCLWAGSANHRFMCQVATSPVVSSVDRGINMPGKHG